MIRILEKIEQSWLLLSVLILLTISCLSLWPLDQLPEVPGTDKTHHFIAYGALAFPAALRRPRHWALLMLFYIFYSGLIELIQPLVKRYGEWLDMLANTTGIICGIGLAAIFRLYKSKAEK